MTGRALDNGIRDRSLSNMRQGFFYDESALVSTVEGSRCVLFASAAAQL